MGSRSTRSAFDEDPHASCTVTGRLDDTMPSRRPVRFGLPVPPPVEVYVESEKDVEEISAENAARALLAGLPKTQEKEKPDWRAKAGEAHSLRAGRPRSTL